MQNRFPKQLVFQNKFTRELKDPIHKRTHFRKINMHQKQQLLQKTDSKFSKTDLSNYTKTDQPHKGSLWQLHKSVTNRTKTHRNTQPKQIRNSSIRILKEHAILIQNQLNRTTSPLR